MTDNHVQIYFGSQRVMFRFLPEVSEDGNDFLTTRMFLGARKSGWTSTVDQPIESISGPRCFFGLYV